LVRALPLTQGFYRQVWRHMKTARAARVLHNPRTFVDALVAKGDGTVLLKTLTGLSVEIRRNRWDAAIVEEVFIDRCYDQFGGLGASPVVVDIGGYIGDFSLYAAKEMGAAKVFVCEPIEENLTLLRRNVERNGLGDRIIVLPVAVSGEDGEIVMRVKKDTGNEVHASAHLYPEAEARKIPCLSFATLMARYDVPKIDLLKIDCEGAEYDIVLTAPDTSLMGVRRLIMEITPIAGYAEKTAAVIEKLTRLGFKPKRRATLLLCDR
jgi:FkbM family methyltransferase